MDSYPTRLGVRSLDVDAELDRIFRSAARLWNAHRFFAFHDTLEEAWKMVKHERKAEPANDPRRDFYHGLILYAAAYVHWMKGNAIGVGRKLADARRLLRDSMTGPHGLDLGRFRGLVEADLARGATGEKYAPKRVPPLVVENG